MPKFVKWLVLPEICKKFFTWTPIGCVSWQIQVLSVVLRYAKQKSDVKYPFGSMIKVIVTLCEKTIVPFAFAVISMIGENTKLTTPWPYFPKVVLAITTLEGVMDILTGDPFLVVIEPAKL